MDHAQILPAGDEPEWFAKCSDRDKTANHHWRCCFLEIFLFKIVAVWRCFRLETFPFRDVSLRRCCPLGFLPFGDVVLWGFDPLEMLPFGVITRWRCYPLETLPSKRCCPSKMLAGEDVTHWTCCTWHACGFLSNRTIRNNPNRERLYCRIGIFSLLRPLHLSPARPVPFHPFLIEFHQLESLPPHIVHISSLFGYVGAGLRSGIGRHNVDLFPYVESLQRNGTTPKSKSTSADSVGVQSLRCCTRERLAPFTQ